MSQGNSDGKLSERRLVENEVIFREVNKTVKEFIGEIDGNSSERAVPFYCECANPDCVEHIKLTAAQYEELHRDKKHFVTLLGHEFPEVENVIRREDGFQVVEKHMDPPRTSEINQALKTIKI